MSIPKKGEMRLYSACIPDMGAGKYTINLKQELSGGTTNSADDTTNIASTALPGVFEDVDKHIEVTGPRLNLAGNEIFGSFPPNHSVGAFDNRLAHITLKRRTLPWERKTGDSTDDTNNRKPWLALVVLAEAEANFNRNVSVTEFTESLPPNVRTTLGLNESASMDLLEVTEEVIEKVFPLRDEVSLLSHVRQVNLADTELAGSDDDGFMAVILSNRLPRRGQSYGAYLISLEERLNVLPERKPNTTTTDNVGGNSVYEHFTADIIAAASSSYAANFYTGKQPATPEVFAISKITIETERNAYITTRNPNLTRATAGFTIGINNANNKTSSWVPSVPQRLARGTSGVSSSAPTSRPFKASKDKADNAAGAKRHTAQATAQPFLFHDMNYVALLGTSVRTVKFPVLANWSFTCTEHGGFEALMQELDIGLHGKTGSQNLANNQELFQPDITDTGHTLIDHLTRQGDTTKSWYRGPLTPRQVVRNLEHAPYHMADQARRLVENGLEDISEAAAFECGRLLALSDTSFIQALMQWRRRDFYVKRKQNNLKLWEKIHPELRAVDALNPKLTERFIQLNTLEKLKNNKKLFGKAALRPIHDVRTTLTPNDMNTISTGLGISAIDVSRTLKSPSQQPVTSLKAAELPAEQDFNAITKNASTEFSHLQSGLKQSLGGIVQNMNLATDIQIDIDQNFDPIFEGSLDQFKLDPKLPGGVVIDDIKLPDDLRDALNEIEGVLKDKLEDSFKDRLDRLFDGIDRDQLNPELNPNRRTR